MFVLSMCSSERECGIEYISILLQWRPCKVEEHSIEPTTLAQVHLKLKPWICYKTVKIMTLITSRSLAGSSRWLLLQPKPSRTGLLRLETSTEQVVHLELLHR